MRNFTRRALRDLKKDCRWRGWRFPVDKETEGAVDALADDLRAFRPARANALETAWFLFIPDSEWEWHGLLLTDFKEGKSIALDRQLLFYTGSLNRDEDHRGVGRTDFVQFLRARVSLCHAMLADGTYLPFIEKSLPLRHREGSIRMADYWKLVPSDRKRIFGNPPVRLEKSFLRWHEEREGDPPPIKGLTANGYLMACLEYYKAKGLPVAGLSPKEAYRKHSDGRCNGLLDVDPDSPEAFARWRHDWRTEGHAFEAEIGRWLYPMEENGRWDFFLWDFVDRFAAELMRDALALVGRGVPVGARHYDDFVKKLEGDYKLRIGSPIFSTFQIEDKGSMPERFLPTNASKRLIDAIRWLPLPKIELED